MKRLNNASTLLCASMLMLNSSIIYAAQPKFNITPVAGTVTSILLPSNFSETVQYQVTNQTQITRTLTMVPMTGVTQTTIGSGVCPNPFTLGSQQSCILTLVVNGSQVPATGINGGPVVCKTKGQSDPSPDPFLCSQPSLQNTLAVSVTSTGQHAYIANQDGNSISVCQVNPATGILTNCSVQVTGLGGPEGVGFNPTGTRFYIANPLNSSITVCQVNSSTGALSSCVDSGGTGFNLPDAVAFSPNGSVFYTSNFGGGGSVSACLVNSTTGLLSSCVNNNSITFSTPGNMTLNSAGTLAYVVNRAASTTSICNVSGQTVDSCDNTSGSQFSGPEGITLSPAGLHAYIANASSANVTVCDVGQDSLGLLANCSVTGGEFRGTGNIGLNSSGTRAYVPNQLTHKIFMCQVGRATGALSECIDSRGTELNGPAGVVLQ